MFNILLLDGGVGCFSHKKQQVKVIFCMTKKTKNNVPGSLKELGTRIKLVADLYASRKSAAEHAGVSADMLSRYMRGDSQPSLAAIAGLAGKPGVNLNWVATGEGAMMLADQAAQPTAPASEAEPAETDLDLLSDCIQAVDEVLSAKGVTLAAAKKARMIGLLYEIHRLESMHTQQPAHVDRNKVIQLVQVAS